MIAAAFVREASNCSITRASQLGNTAGGIDQSRQGLQLLPEWMLSACCCPKKKQKKNTSWFMRQDAPRLTFFSARVRVKPTVTALWSWTGCSLIDRTVTAEQTLLYGGKGTSLAWVVVHAAYDATPSRMENLQSYRDNPAKEQPHQRYCTCSACMPHCAIPLL